MLLLVRRPKWLDLKKRAKDLQHAVLVKLEDGSYKLQMGRVVLVLQEADMKRKLFIQGPGFAASVTRKYFVKKLSEEPGPELLPKDPASSQTLSESSNPV